MAPRTAGAVLRVLQTGREMTMNELGKSVSSEISRLTLRAALLALPLGLAACSGAEPGLGEGELAADEAAAAHADAVELGTARQAWAPGACGRAGANASFDGSVD